MNTDKKEKILFVDDEEPILEASREYFLIKGYQVFTATNGLEALQVLQSEAIDCCFTDINMPGMDGLELAEQIKKLDNSIPVIIMTGYPTLDNALATLKDGVADFLIKPVKLGHMELSLVRVLRERRLFSENILLKKDLEHKKRIEKANRELTKKAEDLSTLNKIMTSLTAIDSSSDVFSRIIELAMEIVRADEVDFYVLSDVVKATFVIASSNPFRKKIKSYNSPDSSMNPSGEHERNAAMWSMEQLLLEIADDEIPLLISENKGLGKLPENILSFMAVPLKIRGKIFGILTAAVTEKIIRFSEKDLYYLSFMVQNAAYAIENLALYENIYDNLFSTLYAFVKTLEARDIYTQQHSESVALMATAIAQEMECSSEELERINIAGRLHDIGKIGIRDDILLKSGKLTKDEYEVIKEHPVIGSGIIGQLGLWDKEQQIIRSHHERYDGSGYPDGLKKDEIPFLARILSVADAFDAMYSDRAYRRKMELNKVIDIIKKEAGAQFDPDVVEAFLRLHKENKILNVVNIERLAQAKFNGD